MSPPQPSFSTSSFPRLPQSHYLALESAWNPYLTSSSEIPPYNAHYDPSHHRSNNNNNHNNKDNTESSISYSHSKNNKRQFKRLEDLGLVLSNNGSHFWGGGQPSLSRAGNGNGAGLINVEDNRARGSKVGVSYKKLEALKKREDMVFSDLNSGYSSNNNNNNNNGASNEEQLIFDLRACTDGKREGNPYSLLNAEKSEMQVVKLAYTRRNVDETDTDNDNDVPQSISPSDIKPSSSALSLITVDPNKTHTIPKTLPSSIKSIYAAFSFSHNVGSNPISEVEVLKCILKRESLLGKLSDVCEEVFEDSVFFIDEDHVNLGNSSEYEEDVKHAQLQTFKVKYGHRFLTLLNQVKSETCNALTLISKWRSESGDSSDADFVAQLQLQLQTPSNVMNPRPFVYANENYVLKMINDMDFVASTPFLDQALGVSKEMLRRNPLMSKLGLDSVDLEEGSSSSEGMNDDDEVEDLGDGVVRVDVDDYSDDDDDDNDDSRVIAKSKVTVKKDDAANANVNAKIDISMLERFVKAEEVLNEKSASSNIVNGGADDDPDHDSLDETSTFSHDHQQSLVEDTDRSCNDGEREVNRIIKAAMVQDEFSDYGSLFSSSTTTNFRPTNFKKSKTKNKKKTDGQAVASYGQAKAINEGPASAYEHELTLWYSKAQAQLVALSQPITGYSLTKSRGLELNRHSKSRLPATEYSYGSNDEDDGYGYGENQAKFQRVNVNPNPSPTKLTQILSSQFSPNKSRASGGNKTKMKKGITQLENVNASNSASGGTDNLSQTLPLPSHSSNSRSGSPNTTSLTRSNYGQAMYAESAVPPPIDYVTGRDRNKVREDAKRLSSRDGLSGVTSRYMQPKVRDESNDKGNGNGRVKKKELRPAVGLSGTAPTPTSSSTTLALAVAVDIPKSKAKAKAKVPQSKATTSTKYTPAKIAAIITKNDILGILTFSLENPSPSLGLHLLAAAFLTITTPGSSLPASSELSWSSFIETLNGINETGISELLTKTNKTTTISGVKSNALIQLITHAQYSPVEVARNSVGCGKICAWTMAFLKDCQGFSWPYELDFGGMMGRLGGFIDFSGGSSGKAVVGGRIKTAPNKKVAEKSGKVKTAPPSSAPATTSVVVKSVVKPVAIKPVAKPQAKPVAVRRSSLDKDTDKVVSRRSSRGSSNGNVTLPVAVEQKKIVAVKKEVIKKVEKEVKGDDDENTNKFLKNLEVSDSPSAVVEKQDSVVEYPSVFDDVEAPEAKVESELNERVEYADEFEDSKSNGEVDITATAGVDEEKVDVVNKEGLKEKIDSTYDFEFEGSDIESNRESIDSVAVEDAIAGVVAAVDLIPAPTAAVEDDVQVADKDDVYPSEFDDEDEFEDESDDDNVSAAAAAAAAEEKKKIEEEAIRLNLGAKKVEAEKEAERVEVIRKKKEDDEKEKEKKIKEKAEAAAKAAADAEVIRVEKEILKIEKKKIEEERVAKIENERKAKADAEKKARAAKADAEKKAKDTAVAKAKAKTEKIRKLDEEKKEALRIKAAKEEESRKIELEKAAAAAETKPAPIDTVEDEDEEEVYDDDDEFEPESPSKKNEEVKEKAKSMRPKTPVEDAEDDYGDDDFE